jgi:hypothetical protein
MVSSVNIQVADLDFDSVKNNLKNYLSGQSQFQDYDFEGAGVNIILDILAYNTVYNGFYCNMAANEAHLDTAQVRNNIVSRAKELGYTPKSVTASHASLTLTFATPPGNPAFITIPAGTVFVGGAGGTAYTFTTQQQYFATASNNYVVDVDVIEGSLYNYQWTVDTTNLDQEFVLPNANVDTTTLNVSVQQSSTSSSIIVFSEAGDISNMNGSSRVYYLQEADDTLFELVFGDGILGQALVNGNIVKVNYIVSHGSAANAIKVFSLSGTIGGLIPAITVALASYGGSDIESTDSIKFTAPKHFEAQDRCVTAPDYQTLLPQKYPFIQAIKVWGGEDSVPPEYGKVFMSIKPSQGLILSNTAKATITNSILKSLNVVSVIPQHVDPNFTYIQAAITVYYDPRLTSLNGDDIKTLVYATINNFGAQQINTFDKALLYTKLTRLIDASEPSITNNLTNISLFNLVDVTTNLAVTYTSDFNNAVQPGSLTSTGFQYSTTAQDSSTFFMEDDGAGNILAYKFVSTSKIYAQTGPVGTIDYTTGHIVLNSLNVTSAVNNQIQINVLPVINDIIPVRNQIILLTTDNVTINVVANP